MMMPHDSQFELFESRPEGKLAPKLDLPFQRSSEVDVRRVASILAVSQNTVLSMLEGKLLRSYRIGSRWRVEYDSVIEHCNQLRVHYRISEDRLLRKPAHGRLRDEDLLPFPIAQTVFAKEVQRRLDIARQNVIYLIEQGDLVGYQVLIDLKASPYRIYRPSLERYMASLRIQAQSKTSARPR
jgi:excisionase family DNA binding protein